MEVAVEFLVWPPIVVKATPLVVRVDCDVDEEEEFAA